MKLIAYILAILAIIVMIRLLAGCSTIEDRALRRLLQQSHRDNEDEFLRAMEEQREMRP